MHHFAYRNGVLHAEAVNLASLAQAVGTPFYCYSTATLERHYRVFAGAFADVPSLVCYAVKANSNQAVIATLAKLGAGADVVSGGELKRALAAGKGRVANVSVRVNPDVDAKTHAKIATGKSENKFGIPISHARDIYAKAARLPGLRVVGVDMHIGSQIVELSPFDDAFALLSDFVRELRADGHTISHVDLGGGLGIPYHEDNDPPPHPDDYAAVVRRYTQNLGAQLIFEPGRLIAGNAGVMISEVIYVKEGEGKTFVIVDAG